MDEKDRRKGLSLSPLLVLVAASFVIVLSACSNDNNNEQTEMYLDNTASVVKNDNYDYHFYYSVEELEEASDHIVKVKGTGERKLVTWKDEYDPTDPGLSGTQATVEITEVFRGSLNKNDTIIVNEPAYFEDQIYYSNQGYNLMSTNKEYLLFLRMSADNGAIIIGMYQGKYDLDNLNEVKFISDLNEYQRIKDVEYFGDQQKVDHFNMLKKQVLDKYK